MPLLELKHVNRGYGQGPERSEVLHDVNLEISPGEFVAIVGFSGSGKTTLVSLLAGLIRPDAGEVLFRGAPVLAPGHDRGVVFQNYSLLPWMSVLDNVLLAVEQTFPGWSHPQQLAHAERYICMVNLGHALHKRPDELSGGMRQRVAVARALAMNPDVLLLDEPLGALDALTRSTLQDEILRIWEQERKTVVLITNDVDEALLLADRVLPLLPGPRASLGSALAVPLPRPRDRKAISRTTAYKRLKADIVQQLMDARRAKQSILLGGAA
jgi:nitrate/nitrite transport system ATP-binding protein